MADQDKRRDEAASKSEREDPEDETAALLQRFPDVPPAPDIPEAPRIVANLPPHPDKARPGAVAPGSYKNAGLAYSAASAFIMPIIVLSLGGWWLDRKLNHATFWLAFGGVLLGLIVGVTALLRVVNQMNDDPPKRG